MALPNKIFSTPQEYYAWSTSGISPSEQRAYGEKFGQTPAQLAAQYNAGGNLASNSAGYVTPEQAARNLGVSSPNEILGWNQDPESGKLTPKYGSGEQGYLSGWSPTPAAAGNNSTGWNPEADLGAAQPIGTQGRPSGIFGTSNFPGGQAASGGRRATPGAASTSSVANPNASQNFLTAYDNSNFLRQAGVDYSGTSIESAMSNGWQDLLDNVDIELRGQEQNALMTLVETLGSAFKDTFQTGIAGLDARGLSTPDLSTSADYWTNKWTAASQAALVQGVRDIQNSYSQQRLNWTQFGVTQATDWAKFQVSSALTQRGQDLQAMVSGNSTAAQLAIAGINANVATRGQDITAATTQRGQDVELGINSQRLDQDWQQFLASNATTQRGQDITVQNANSALAQNQAQFNASQGADWQRFLGQTATTLRGQDLGYAANSASNNTSLSIANSQADAANSASQWNFWSNILSSLVT